jgi:N-acetylglucosamine-6-phosphate deacetylase
VKLGVAAALVDGRLVPGDVEAVDGLITRVGVAGRNGRGTAVPGFIDLQVNGFAGVDFLNADASGYRRAGEALLETGVTGYLPTFITSPEAVVVAAMREVPILPDGPRILGIHLEGPFLSPLRLGTHPREDRRDPDVELLRRLLDAGPVRMMTLAPELRGIRPVVDELFARGVTVSAGHTDANTAQANAAFDYGIRTVTHLFNAMRPLEHREPGIAGAALARDDVIVQIINDGVHLAPETVRMIWQAARGRVALVTDAIAGAAAPPGTYRFGSLEITVRDGEVRGPNGGLAGSVLTMIEAVRNLHALGASFEDAVAAATSVPADVIGLSAAGRIAVGQAADVVVLDDHLEIESVFVSGEARVSARG